MLQFCQQCEIYHNVTTTSTGQRVITECQRRINELTNHQSSQQSGDIIYFNRNDFSPKSKASFTSINGHIVQPIPQQSSIRQSVQNIGFGVPNGVGNKVAYVPPKMVFPPQNVSVRINFVPPPQMVQNKRPPLRLAVSSNKENMPFMKVQSKKNLLSTIREEGSESSPRQSGRSINSSETQQVTQEPRLTYKFKDLRSKEAGWPMFQAQPNEKQPICWCW